MKHCLPQPEELGRWAQRARRRAQRGGLEVGPPRPPQYVHVRARVCVWLCVGGVLQLRVQGTLRAAEQVAELRLEPLPRKQTERAA